MWDGPVAGADPAEQDRQFALMRSSRVETLRVVFSWARIQPTFLAPDFEETDRLVALAARHGVRLLPVVIEAPGWAKQDGFTGQLPAARPGAVRRLHSLRWCSATGRPGASGQLGRTCRAGR